MSEGENGGGSFEEEFLVFLRERTPTELRIIQRDLQDHVSAKKDSAAVNEAVVGTSRDTAVQKLAALQLVDLRQRGHSYRQIGELVDVSYERIRQIYERLCPLEYERESPSRRKA